MVDGFIVLTLRIDLGVQVAHPAPHGGFQTKRILHSGGDYLTGSGRDRC